MPKRRCDVIMTLLLRHVSAGLEESYWSPCAAINSLWPSDTTWRHGTWSTNIQAMVCCPMAPSHCMNPYWLISSKVLWHSPKRNFSGNNQNICPRYDFDNYWYKLTAASHKDQWVKMYRAVGFRLLRLLTWINSSPPGQNGRSFADDTFQCIFVNEKFFILKLFETRK